MAADIHDDRMGKLISITVIGFLFTATVARGGEIAFDRRILESGDRVDHVTMADVSGDGKKDILLQNGHDIRFFVQQPSGFAAKPDHVVRLPGNAFLWTLGKMADDGRPGLVAMTSGGVLVYPPIGAASKDPTEVLILPQMFEGESTKPPQYTDFLPDLNDDGRSDIVVFGKGRMSIFLRRDGRFTLHQKIQIPMESDLAMPVGPNRAIEDVLYVPMLSFGDVNGDGRKDIGYFHAYRLTNIVQDDQGRFRTSEKGTTDFSEGKKRRRHYINVELPPQVKDLNGDGALDIVTVDPRKGRIKVYYAKKGGVAYDAPDEILNLNGWSAGCFLKDINGDGRLDLVATEVNKMGVVDGLKTFLSKKVSVHLVFFPMGSNGRLATEAVQRITFSIPYVVQLTLEEGTIDLVFRPNLDGDFNGDGYRDVLIKLDDDALDLYEGTKEGAMSADRSRQIAISPPAGVDRSDPFIDDLNGDGVSDILLRHFDVDEQKQHVELLMSRRK